MTAFLTAVDDPDTAVATRPAGGAPANIFADSKQQKGSALAETDKQRAIAEVQAAMVIAQQFPRNQVAAMDRILNACTRKGLAEKALYSYARGGSDITGPSIRLAEALAQQWGNMQFGIRELEQRPGESTVEAYAWDVETNTRSVKVFQVPHERHTRNGVTKLKDPRDIYELVANQGARRLRACILAVIPGDVIEAALIQAETTLRTNVKITPELIESIVAKFSALGVSRKAIETRIQRRIDVITPALVVNLGKILNSIQDGMSSPADWFELEPAAPAETGTKKDAVKAALDSKIAPAAATTGGAKSEEGQQTLLPSDDIELAVDLSKMNAAALTAHIKGEAAKKGIEPELLDDLVADCGGWQKKNAEKILAKIEAFEAPVA